MKDTVKVDVHDFVQLFWGVFERSLEVVYPRSSDEAIQSGILGRNFREDGICFERIADVDPAVV
jgi:hypothetical protein